MWILSRAMSFVELTYATSGDKKSESDYVCLLSEHVILLLRASVPSELTTESDVRAYNAEQWSSSTLFFVRNSRIVFSDVFRQVSIMYIVNYDIMTWEDDLDDIASAVEISAENVGSSLYSVNVNSKVFTRDSGPLIQTRAQEISIYDWDISLLHTRRQDTDVVRSINKKNDFESPSGVIDDNTYSRSDVTKKSILRGSSWTRGWNCWKLHIWMVTFVSSHTTRSRSDHYFFAAETIIHHYLWIDL